MKMTMHIDEDLLDRVMKIHGCASKTEAVDLALREIERRHLLRGYGKTGLGLSATELRDAIDPNYDLLASREATSRTSYGKRRSR